MILDTIDRLGCYAGLHPCFAKAADWFAAHDFASLPDGRTEIDGENVFVNTAENELNRTELAWEAHDLYADIQLILSGEERFAWSDRAEMEPLRPGTDFRACRAEARAEFTLRAGEFVIFLPGEPHAPGNPAGQPGRCRKAVIKVRCGEPASERRE